METWKLIVDVAQGISIILAAWAAIYGIDAWRREHIGKRRLELAEETLAMFYQARDALRHIRSPGSFAHEYADRENRDSEGAQEQRWNDTAYTTIHRYNSYRELFSKMHATRYQFMARFGADSAKPFDDFRQQVNSVITAAQMLPQIWRHGEIRTGENTFSTPAVEFECRMWEGMSEAFGRTDEIKLQADAAVEAMEKTCKAVIMSKSTIFGFLNFPLGKT